MRGFRLGSAFILLGVITLTVFLVTLTIEQGDPWTLVAGAALSAAGLYLRRRNIRAKSGLADGDTGEDEQL